MIEQEREQLSILRRISMVAVTAVVMRRTMVGTRPGPEDKV